MASPSLALPGVIFVGEDEKARLVAHLGPAAGWMIPRGVLGWSTEVSVVLRDAITDAVKRDAKIVMPEEQIPTGKYPLAHQAALKSPIIAISSRLTQKLVDSGIRVHTVGADRVTSSFYYLAEGGGEEPQRIEGDLVAAVGAMLGDRADNAAIERVLDGLVDRLVRSLSKDRVTELSLELAHALPRAAADGSGLQDIDLDAFEKEVAGLVGASEKYAPFLQEIATKLNDTNDRKIDIPLFGDAKKVSQGPFDLEVGTKKVPLVTHDRWLATGPLTEPKAAAKPVPAAPKSEPKAAPPPAKSEPKPQPASVQKVPSPKPAAVTPKAEPVAAKAEAVKPKETTPKPAAAKLPTSEPKVAAAKAEPTPAPAPAKVEEPKPEPVVAKAEPEAPKPEPAKPVEAPKPEPAKVEPKPQPAKPEPAKVEKKAEPAPEPAKKAEPAKAEKKAEPKTSEPAIATATKARPTSEPKAATPLAKATPATPAKQEKGFPWIVIVILLALAAAGFGVWRSRHK